jgi:hypothetical protein
MLANFDQAIILILDELMNPFDGITDKAFISFFKNNDSNFLRTRRGIMLRLISEMLRRLYGKPVVVLIDEYDSPMHSAIAHGYAVEVRYCVLLCWCRLRVIQASEFFSVVFGSLLKVCRRRSLKRDPLTIYCRITNRCMEV